jgi:hypothetical protein
MKQQIIKIKTDEENPEPIELIAKAVIAMSDNFQKALNSGLTERAIVVLIHDAIPGRESVSIQDIKTVLKYASELKKHYIKQTK